jgi:hypothetical protein
MLATGRPLSMTVEEALAIRHDSCGTRARFGPSTARAVAARRNGVRPAQDVRPWSAYRCCFATDGHWHVGRVITVPGMVRLALAIRTLRQAA